IGAVLLSELVRAQYPPMLERLIIINSELLSGVNITYKKILVRRSHCVAII
ncbi:hypothetical protein BO94DRAFT_479977, partial [Aspergillus sclerotioniger CBS 115572]